MRYLTSVSRSIVGARLVLDVEPLAARPVGSLVVSRGLARSTDGRSAAAPGDPYRGIVSKITGRFPLSGCDGAT
jgi:hypothetical protein